MGRVLRNEAEEVAGILTTNDRGCHDYSFRTDFAEVVTKEHQAEM